MLYLVRVYFHFDSLKMQRATRLRKEDIFIIHLDDELVKKEIREQLHNILKDTHELWLWDVDMLAKKTCMSQTFLEEEFLSDPRMKKIEIRKSRKRWYPVDAAKEVLMNIMSEW